MFLNFWANSYFVFTELSDVQSLYSCYSAEPNIMHMRNCSSSSSKVNYNSGFCVTLWSMNCFGSSRSKWKLFSYNLNSSIFTKCKHCGNRFDRCPSRLDALGIQLSVIMSGFSTYISMVKLDPYDTRWSVWCMKLNQFNYITSTICHAIINSCIQWYFCSFFNCKI